MTTPTTRKEITAAIKQFMGVWRDTFPPEITITCDTTNNTKETIAQNQLIVNLSGPKHIIEPIIREAEAGNPTLTQRWRDADR